jgi:hypothetical protein
MEEQPRFCHLTLPPGKPVMPPEMGNGAPLLKSSPYMVPKYQILPCFCAKLAKGRIKQTR